MTNQWQYPDSHPPRDADQAAEPAPGAAGSTAPSWGQQSYPTPPQPPSAHFPVAQPYRPGQPPNQFAYQQPQGYPNAQPYGWGYQAYGASAQNNGMATASMVLGIIFLVFFFLGLLTLTGAVLAIVFGGIGSTRAGRMGGKGKGKAIAGIILGSISLLFYVILGAATLGAGWIV